MISTKLLPRSIRILKQRKEYYKACQKITDHIHDTLAREHRNVSDRELSQIFGHDKIGAFTHELNIMNVPKHNVERTEALEWLHHSRFFEFKSSGENREIWNFIRSWAAFIISVIALAVTYCDAKGYFK